MYHPVTKYLGKAEILYDGDVAMKEDFEAIVIQGMPHHESVWLNNKLPKTYLLLDAVYRPPNTPNSYLENMPDYFEGIANRNRSLIIVRDFHLPGIN